MRAMWSLVALLGGLGVAQLGCHGKETDEVLAGLRAENQQLRAELAAARAENVVLVENGAGPKWQGTVSLKRVGGNAGRTMYQRDCPAGQALSGFGARIGSVVDGLVPVCTPVVQLPGTKGTRTLERELAMVGGRGGRPGETVCPGQTLVVGVRGRAADVVDSIEPVCEQGKAGPRLGGAGGRDYERMCPVGWVAVGLTGRQGDYVESVSLTCADPRALPGYMAPATVRPGEGSVPPEEGGPRRRLDEDAALELPPTRPAEKAPEGPQARDVEQAREPAGEPAREPAGEPDR